MFPDVNTKEWNVWGSNRVLVCGGHHFDALILGVEGEPSPARALDTCSSGGDFLLHVFVAAEVALNCLGEC